MLPETFLSIMSKEGVAPIVSWSDNNANVTATWNSYIQITDDERLLIPAAGMHSTQKDSETNPNIKMVFGSKEVMGLRSMGAGFALEGTARFIDEGEEFEMMKGKFPFLSRVLEVTIKDLKQTL